MSIERYPHIEKMCLDYLKERNPNVTTVWCCFSSELLEVDSDTGDETMQHNDQIQAVAVINGIKYHTGMMLPPDTFSFTGDLPNTWVIKVALDSILKAFSDRDTDSTK